MYALTMLLLLATPDAHASDVALRDQVVPRDDSTTLSAGLATAATGDWLAAQRSFQSVADNSADRAMATTSRIATAECLFQQANYTEAAIRFAELHEEYGQSSHSASRFVALRWAHCLAHKGQWAQAKSVAEAALAAKPDSAKQANLQYILGRCASANHDHASAREHYFQVVRNSEQASPIRTRAQWMIAHSYAAEGELQTAREAFLRIEQQQQADAPLSARAIIEAGRCSERRGEWQAAAALYQRVVTKYPQVEASPEARRRLRVVEIRREPTRR